MILVREGGVNEHIHFSLFFFSQALLKVAVIWTVHPSQNEKK